MAEGTMAAIVVAAISGGVVTKFIELLVAWVKGKHAREQTGWEKYDKAMRRLRMVLEVLHETRLLLHKRTGMPYGEMPPIPEFRDDT